VVFVSFHERLLELRKKQGLSQYAICTEFGVARSTYSDWENGRKKPDMNMLIKIADYFQVSMDYLLDRNNPTVAASKADDPLADLTVEGRKSVEEFIEFVRLRDKNM
jgi:transcriptional regulator with XRE-family HTH domain